MNSSNPFECQDEMFIFRTGKSKPTWKFRKINTIWATLFCIFYKLNSIWYRYTWPDFRFIIGVLFWDSCLWRKWIELKPDFITDDDFQKIRPIGLPFIPCLSCHGRIMMSRYKCPAFLMILCMCDALISPTSLAGFPVLQVWDTKLFTRSFK